MSWTSLSDPTRINSLPLVLAGPIVRKTTASSVSIWIALKSSQPNLILIVKEMSGSGFTKIKSGPGATIAFGKNLHIAVITVDGLSLTADKLYYYDIEFGSQSSLSTPGILSGGNESGLSKIVYNGQDLPSFLLPSSDMAKLKIVHASCRKPHGGAFHEDERDAFEAIDVLLSQSISNTNTRPQQLYLTGDQIYADDVSDLLLFMLRDAEKFILNWNSTETLPSLPYDDEMQPGHRGSIINKACFTSGAAASHLLLLGEFYSMYLFVWSEELWPKDPNFYPEYSDYSSYAVGVTPVAKMLSTYKRNKEILYNFFKTIEKVRRLLANISTYMMFDDHEITDDWYLNREWFEDVEASADGKRIIQNGLSAFGIFQAWGNTPERFSGIDTDENKLLGKLSILNANEGVNINTWNEVAAILLPHLIVNNLEGGIDWSYSLVFAKFNAIVLNTRTNRRLADRFFNLPQEKRKKRNIAGLLSPNALINQLKNRYNEKLNKLFTLIIAPAPVFGLRLMEELIQPIVAEMSSAATGDTEAWTLDKTVFESFLKELVPFERVLLLSGDVHYSFSCEIDYWLGKEGDQNKKTAKFVNLTASSLKNSAGGPQGPITLATAVNKRIVDSLLPAFQIYMTYNLGWNNPGPYIKTETRIEHQITVSVIPGTTNVNNGVLPHVHNLIPKVTSGTTTVKEWFENNEKPDWEYAIKLHSDKRSAEARNGGILPPLVDTIPGIGKKHQESKELWDNHSIVGNNSIGEISFLWEDSGSKKVIHKIWSKKSANEVFPLTIHVVDFGIVSEMERPSKLGKPQ